MRKQLLIFWISCLLLVGVWVFLFLDFFPNNNGKIGHDYAYFLPQLLVGFYWFNENGIVSVPYFSPAFCAGVPYYVNPQNLYFSVPQFLSFVTNPLNAVIITFVIFAIIGFSGCYLLLKKVFCCSTWAVILGATLFLFNGFYAYRVVIGHLTFHGFMLVPLIVYFLLYKVKDNDLFLNLFFAVLASISASYLVYSGGAHMLLPIALAVLAIILIYAIRHEVNFSLLKRFAMTVCILPMLSASKVVAGFSTIQQLPRDAYPLPGVDNVFSAIILPLKLLFYSAESSSHFFTNMFWRLGRHEFEFGVTIVPLLIVLFWLTTLLKNNPELPKIKKSSMLYFSGFILVLFIPIAVNFYTPEFNATLKSIPILKNSANLVRWYLLYIPVTVVLASIVFDLAKLGSAKKVVALGLIGVIIWSNIFEDKSYYHNQPYNPRPVLENYDYIKAGGNVRNIMQVRNSKVTDASYIAGTSRLNCYEALFGYRHEFFPQKHRLSEGDALQISNGFFNMKNPSCYTYPKVNNCRPGDHFSIHDEKDLIAFLEYKPYNFKISTVQQTANIISIFTALISLILICFMFIKYICTKILRWTPTR